MKMKCNTCGSHDVEIVPDGTVTVIHSVDIRHYPPELSDKELEDFAAEGRRTFDEAMNHVVDRHRHERDTRRAARGGK